MGLSFLGVHVKVHTLTLIASSSVCEVMLFSSKSYTPGKCEPPCPTVSGWVLPPGGA